MGTMKTARNGLERFNRKYGKNAIDEATKFNVSKAEENKTTREKGEDMMAANGGKKEDVFAVIGYQGMEMFVNMFKQDKEEMRQVVREELQHMLQGVLAGAGQFIQDQKQPEPKVEEPVEFDMTNITPIDELIKRHQEVKFRNPLIDKGESIQEELRRELGYAYQIPRSESGRIKWGKVKEDDAFKSVFKQIAESALESHPGMNIYSLKDMQQFRYSDLTGAYQYFNRNRELFDTTWKEYVSPLINK